MTLTPRARRIVFAGAARDCAPYLPEVLDNLGHQASLADESAFIVVENDSRDASKRLLADWGAARPNFTLLSLDGLAGIAIRTMRLELVRNAYVEFIRSHPRFREFDYLCVLDLDDSSTRPLDSAKLVESLDFLDAADDRAGVFANQLGTYFDMWAFRHPELCPDDPWEAVLNCATQFGVSDSVAFARTFARRVRTFEPTGEMLEVDSAFGGWGVYKMSHVLRNPNPYMGFKVRVTHRAGGAPELNRLQICEHVHFNAGIRAQGGRLFVKTDLINKAVPKFDFVESFYRSLVF